MSVAVNISILENTAYPAVKRLQGVVTPKRINTAIRDPLVSLVKRNYEKQPPTKSGGPSTGFWQDASKSTRGEVQADGVLITTDKIGVRQQLLGGRIKAGINTSRITGKLTANLAIPATPLAHGKTPSDFPNLKYMQFGRGQDAPKALVALGEVSTQIAQKRGKLGGFKPVASNVGLIVMFWLVKEVTQAPHPGVIPSDEAFQTTMTVALEPLMKEAGLN